MIVIGDRADLKKLSNRSSLQESTMSSVESRQVDNSISIRANLALNRYHLPNEVEQVIRDLLTQLDSASSIEETAALYNLTATEKQILQLLASGYTVNEISERTGKKIGTVRVHKQNIYNKTRTNHIAALLALIIKTPPLEN